MDSGTPIDILDILTQDLANGDFLVDLASELADCLGKGFVVLHGRFQVRGQQINLLTPHLAILQDQP
ncbi:hypothetical protein [Desulfonatronospira sp.]|uniref:hypothetical protein n=1 Tax=Desulfonatronospira sp. TaxID=1962951 RepID=UPI0025BA7E97|nr:hypothetical protein [Desulfonatronospira sp.]